MGSKTEIGLIERITKRKSMRPMPSITGGAPRNPSTATRDPAGGDILAAIRDVMPGATPAPTVEPAPRKDEATTPEAADVPLVGGGEEPAAPSDPRPTPPNPPTPSGHRWPAPEVVHVDPDDILGPIRYLMTDAKTKPALDTQQKKPATPPRPPIVSPLMAAPPAPLGPAPSRPPSRAPSRPPEGAWDRLVGLFKKPLLDVPDDHPLASMARRVSQNLYVERLELRFADASDDAVRFERQTTTLVVNPEHPTVRVLIESGDVVPLVAAAFSEINRELKTVSDDEERRALGRLLLDPPARAS
ncbi:MAG: hypothetical protein JNK04_06210 [Myxococcales bacterium]|nr:hypothetical protein [Myxococcales bacterium]